MPRHHTDATKRRVFHAIDNGESLSSISRRLNVSRKTLYQWKKGRSAIESKLKSQPQRERMWEEGLPPPLFSHELGKEAVRALEDFGYWRYRYLGRRSTPWQEQAATEVNLLIHSPDTEMAVINMPPGSGKPVAVDALITMADGSRKRLGDIEEGDWVISHRGRPCLVSAVHEQGLLPCKFLTDDTGRTVTTAFDHPFLTYDEWGKDEWVRADEMGGRESPFIPFEPVVGSYRTPEEFRLAGYFVGDGSCSAGNAAITNADPGVLADIELCAKTLGWTDTTSRQRNGCASVTKFGGGARDWLREARLYGKTSHTKRVPPWVFTAPNRLVAQFLGAYFDCDGMVDANGRGVQYDSVHRSLLVDCLHLLNRLGICAAVKEKRRQGGTYLSFALAVYDRDIFASLVPVRGVKADRLALCTKRRGVGGIAAPSGKVTVSDARASFCRCLNVDGDHSFIADGFPVHNTTTFTHDIPAWLICRDRTIRIMLGHRVSRIAYTYSARLRRTLQRTRPLPAGPGREAAIACLAEDYGRFKPTYNDAWRNEEFMVMLSIDEDTPDESALEDKEPTVAAFGMESEFLGTRANAVFWDDLVTGEILRSADQIAKQQLWWEEEGQTRVEPGGFLGLLGQRMGGDDLFNYALSQKLEDTDEPRYKHIIFPAHDDEHCGGEEMHQQDSPMIGQGGCLLDAHRIPWHGKNGLLTIKQNTPAKYEIQYQQRDVAKSEVLVPKIWIDGGKDSDGVEYPGCWDGFRSVGDVSALRGLSLPYYSVVTVDPSATNWWAVEWWILHPASNQAFLVDLHHERMDGPDLLDWNANSGVWYGLLQEWVIRASLKGAPISHLIVEANACQRWLLQFDHSKRWAQFHRVLVLPHTTSSNKLDPLLGIQSIKDWFKYGQIRLPGAHDGSRNVVAPLVDEATKYEPAKPKARPDDCLMAAWFMRFHWPKIAVLHTGPRITKVERPTWAAA